MNVRRIAERYTRGTVLDVWIDTFGGPSYFGRFVVDAKTIRHMDTGQIWGEIVKEYAAFNHGLKPRIARVEIVKKA
ncbi:MAG: hypothetical protein IMW95_12360 [Moorella humiferrea]|nr:hypothetical protein [Moorella humiferrea]